MSTEEKPLPRLRATLMRRYPGVRFAECVLGEKGQRITFQGQRELLSFVPSRAFAQACYRQICDENGDSWTVYPWEGVWAGWGYIKIEGPETPPGARRWPLKGIQAQVDRMLRKARRRPKERATG